MPQAAAPLLVPQARTHACTALLGCWVRQDKLYSSGKAACVM